MHNSTSKKVQMSIAARTSQSLRAQQLKAEISHFNLWFQEQQILHDISLPLYQQCITAIIGPSGCGKSTLLRCFNRMNDFILGTKLSGDILIDSEPLYKNPQLDVHQLRTKVGMVFQKPNPFPKSIYENVAYGLKLQRRPRKYIAERVEQSLKEA